MNYSVTFLLLFISTSILASETPYTIDGMVGVQPTKICWLIEKMKSPKGFQNMTIKNRLILHGPPGNGKTTLAKKLADETGSTLLKLDGPSIVEKYVGSGAQNIS